MFDKLYESCKTSLEDHQSQGGHVTKRLVKDVVASFAEQHKASKRVEIVIRESMFALFGIA